MSAHRVVCLLAVMGSWAANATDLDIRYPRTANRGFYDPRPVEPDGLNFAKTYGAQAYVSLQAAAAMWGAVLKSPVPIVIDGSMVGKLDDPRFDCKRVEGALLGYCLAPGSIIDARFPVPTAEYPYALANALAGEDLVSGSSHLIMRFNADLGAGDCDEFEPWSFSLEEMPSTLMKVALHEIAHGIGFTSNVDKANGLFLKDPTPYDYQLWDSTQTPAVSFVSLADARRKSLIVKPGALVLGGPRVVAEAPRFLSFPRLTATPSVGDPFEVAYSPDWLSDPLVGTFELVRVTPGALCVFGPEATGKMAFVDENDCAANRYSLVIGAMAAGARGVVVWSVDEVTDPFLISEQPNGVSVVVSRSVGTALAMQLGQGSVSVRFGPELRVTGVTPTGVAVHTPKAVAGASSLVHWFDGTLPKPLLMSPFGYPAIRMNLDLTPAALADMGWPIVNGLGVQVVKAKTGPARNQGEEKYLVALVNRRTTAIDSVTLELAAPGLTVKSFAGGCTAAPCTLSMAAGEVALVIATVSLAGLSGETLAVTATALPSSPDPEDSLTADTVTPIAYGGDLSIALSRPEKLEVGQVASFSVKVANAGPGSSADVLVKAVVKGEKGVTYFIDLCTEKAPCVLPDLERGESYFVSGTRRSGGGDFDDRLGKQLDARFELGQQLGDHAAAGSRLWVRQLVRRNELARHWGRARLGRATRPSLEASWLLNGDHGVYRGAV